MQQKTYAIDIGGKPLIAEFSDLAEQANGSVLIRYGETVLLATAVMSLQQKEGADFFPLTVDYEERFYAAGEILGSRFIRREGRPTDEAILSGRVVDRTIRPLFNQQLRHEVQVIITVLSIGEDDPDILGVVGASLALSTSNIPWAGPVGAVRIGKHRGSDQFEINPTYASRGAPDVELDLLICGKDNLVNMVEVSAKETAEATMIAAMEAAVGETAKLQAWQETIAREIGREKHAIERRGFPSELPEFFLEKVGGRLTEVVFSAGDKRALGDLKREWLQMVEVALPDASTTASLYFEERLDELMHREVIDRNRRPDGRGLDEMRPLQVKAGGISPVVHGAGLFYRGGTHILSILTLGGPGDALLIDNMEIQETKKRFMHHYNFPPFSTGETGRIGPANRRMIGHGALAEKALAPVIPTKEEFPYTIRLVSEAFASSGSTSMGSVCASTLALMDGGVPISAPVAGIAMGLMYESPERYRVLTDIQGPEDHHGDMDCKVAGTKAGITAVQMDVKITGIPVSLLADTFEKARTARLNILRVMEGELGAPRKDLSPRAPRITSCKIKKEQIGLVIGTGGKTVNDIKEKSGVDAIDIEEDGTIFITGSAEAVRQAVAAIQEITHEYKKGERFMGEVTKIFDFGAAVKIGNNTEGLVHISEISPRRIERVDAVLKEGDRVPVVIKDIDEKNRMKLSIKQADPQFITPHAPDAASPTSPSARRHGPHQHKT